MVTLAISSYSWSTNIYLALSCEHFDVRDVVTYRRFETSLLWIMVKFHASDEELMQKSDSRVIFIIVPRDIVRVLDMDVISMSHRLV